MLKNWMPAVASLVVLFTLSGCGDARKAARMIEERFDAKKVKCVKKPPDFVGLEEWACKGTYRLAVNYPFWAWSGEDGKIHVGK